MMVLSVELFDSKLLLITLLCLLYYYATSTYYYWRKRGVPYIKPVPLFGSSLSVFYSSQPAHEHQQDVYKKYKQAKYVGRFQMRRPDLVVLDPDIISRILVEDFNNFRNRGFKADGKVDPLSQHLVNMDGPKWKSLRSKLSPVFSSGKLKTMHHHLIECSNHLKQFMIPLVDSPGGFEARDLLAGFSTDVIGHCAFGIQMNALNDPNSYFKMIARRVSNPTFASRVKFLFRKTLPGLLTLLRWKSIPQKMEDFFVGVIKEAMRVRESQNTRVPDFLQLLIDVKNEDDRRLKEKEKINFNEEVIFDEIIITANAFVFFAAGFETTSLTLSFCLFELSQNEDIQIKLRKEIQMVLRKYNGVPTFEAIKEMIYMDQVLSETLRKYPPAVSSAREVTMDYKIKETGLTLETNCTVSFPIYCLHHDPEFFPEPEKFKPERFSEENKWKLKKGTYLPFGDGPRMCIVVFDELLLTANAFVFFVAGFGTTASTLGYCLYELSKNQDIQNQTRKEVQSILNKYNGIPTFEAVKEMTYLDQVISETLRKYPIVPSLPRELSNNYTISETGLVLEKGSMIQIPVYALHHDPDLYPEPEKFDPDRFSEENIRSIKKGTYLPFGDGPRMCIGMRFAKMEMRVVLATLLNEFKFFTNPKTLSPLQFNPKSIILVPNGGLWLNIKKIS